MSGSRKFLQAVCVCVCGGGGGGGGGGGSPGQTDRKSFDNALIFFSSQLILHRGSNGYFKENYNLPRFQGVLTFPRGWGGPAFS